MNEEHVELLRQDVDGWNQWRQDNPEIVPDFAEADFAEENLSGADLTMTNLTGANLYGADFSHADLTSADLTMANLTGANLYRAGILGTGKGRCPVCAALDSGFRRKDELGGSHYRFG